MADDKTLKKNISFASITLGVIVGVLVIAGSFFGIDAFIDTQTIKAPPAVILDVEKPTSTVKASGTAKQEVEAQATETTASSEKTESSTPIESDQPPANPETEPARVIPSSTEQEGTPVQEPKEETPPAVTPQETAEKIPSIIVVISDLGLSQQATTQALALPAAFTLSFPTYADQIALWIQKARELKHETLLSIPMEPATYPQDDPGPNSLLLSLPDTENIRRLNDHLAKASGYVGIATHMGTGFLASKEKIEPVLDDLGKKRLMILETEKTAETVLGALARTKGFSYHAVDRMIDADLSPKSIEDSLDFLIATAKSNGSAIGMTRPYPVVLEKLDAWSKTLNEFGVVLQPISVLDQK